MKAHAAWLLRKLGLIAPKLVMPAVPLCVDYPEWTVDWPACRVPPPGWWCSRAAGHDGPCAARPIPITMIANDVEQADGTVKRVWSELVA